MALFEIKSWMTGKVLFSLETERFKLCVEAAIKSSADLSYADLRYANLRYANLRYANLSSANLSSADLRYANLSYANLSSADLSFGNKKLSLVGERPFFQIGPIGSRADYLLSFLTDNGVYVRAGCFWNTLEKFKVAVTETHGTGIHADEYNAAITLIEVHARIYTPAAEAAA